MSTITSSHGISVKLSDTQKEAIIREIYPLSSYTFRNVDEVIEGLRKSEEWGLFDSPVFARTFLIPANIEIMMQCSGADSECDYARSLVDATFRNIILKNRSLYLLPPDYSSECLSKWEVRKKFAYLYNFLARFAGKLRQQKLDSSPITKDDIKHIKLPSALTRGSPGMSHTAVVVQQVVKAGLLAETSDQRYKFPNSYYQNVFLARYLYKRDPNDGWMNEFNSVDSILANEALFCSFFDLLREVTGTAYADKDAIISRVRKCLQHMLKVFEESCPLTYSRIKAEGPCTKDTHSFLPESELDAPRYALFILKCMNESGYYDVTVFHEEIRKIFYIYTLYAFDFPECRLKDRAAFTRLERLWRGEALTSSLCTLLKDKSTRLIGLNLLVQVRNIGDRLQYNCHEFHRAITDLYEESDDLEEINLMTQIFSKYFLYLIKNRGDEVLTKDSTIDLFQRIKDEKVKTLIRNHLKQMTKSSLGYFNKYFVS